MNQAIAFLGLGLMGSAMTANLARAGFRVTGWNRTSDRATVEIARQAGAAIASSIPLAVADADLIFCCLGDVPDVEAVLFAPGAAADSAKPGALIIDMSTIGAIAARKFGQLLQTRGLRFLDAPVSGGDIGARNGTLTIMVGGEHQDFLEAQPYFAAMGRHICLCGKLGAGQGVKLCNQVLAAINTLAVAEALTLASHLGVAPQQLIEVCGTGAAGSWSLTNLGTRMAKSDFAPGFAIAHLLKDLRLIREEVQNSDSAIAKLLGVELVEELLTKIEPNLGTQAIVKAYQPHLPGSIPELSTGG